MATKPLRSIKFPDLPDTYTVPQPDGSYQQMTVGNAEQLVATVGIEDKVPYNFRTSGGADDIGDREVDKVIGGTVAWNQLVRMNAVPSADHGITYTASVSGDSCIVTGTATANEQRTGWFGVSDEQLISGHRILITSRVINGSYTGHFRYGITQLDLVEIGGATIRTVLTTGQKRLATYIEEGTAFENDFEFQMNFYDLTQMFGSTIADYIRSLESSTAGAGVAFFRSLFPAPYYAYNAGTLMHVQTSAHKMTGFNQWDEEWENGRIVATNGVTASGNGIRSKNFIRVIPNTGYYFQKTYANYPGASSVVYAYYDENKTFISGGEASTFNTFTTPSGAAYMKFCIPTSAAVVAYPHDICINLHWDGERDGEYEPYEEHTYPLDSDLVLRGIPKLDANNNLYYDGDEYESDGTVARKYGIVDLGTLEWHKSQSGNNFYAKVPSPFYKMSPNGIGTICARYKYVSGAGDNGYYPSDDKAYRFNYSAEPSASACEMYIHDESYSDATAFATALSGVYMVYELATPTTESADPYQNPQVVNDWGTEEYVDSRTVPIPVGHDTIYRANLRAKLEMAPDSPSADGDYIVRHENGENAYVLLTKELPTLPTTDGSYHLKCTVASGTATLTWEEDQA